jgi:hypothetical protein
LTPEKKRRLETAAGFLSGVLACMDALRDARVVWPVAEMWDGLRNVKRVEFGAGVALIVVSFIISIVQRKDA